MIASEVRRNTELGYPIAVGDVRADLRRFIASRPVVVLYDRGAEAALEALRPSLRGARAMVGFDLGERRKRLSTVERILDALVAAGADRSTTVLGIGGGVASDCFGLCAALFMRGVPYAHLGTTLVAMVDASIGGKTGVDLARAKNTAGVFADPCAVFAPIDTLRTLPYRRLREGLAEMVKHAIIDGGDHFETLERLAPHAFWRWPWDRIVPRSIAVKTAVVAHDRLERGPRALLNLGHTFAHGIETASRYRVTHGAAVAVGLRAAGLLALRTGRFTREEHLRVLTLLTLLRLPVATSQSPTDVLAAMRSDKKRRDGRLRFVLPRALGDVEYGVGVSDRAVHATLERLTRLPSADEFH